MNSLAMETLLDVDEERTMPKALKRARADDTTADRPVPSVSRSVLFENDEMPDIAGEENGKIAMTDAGAHGGISVVKSYQINRWCMAQVLRDSEAGQYRYELTEPQLSVQDRKKYDAIVAELHKKTRSALAEMRRIGGRERIMRQFDHLCGERGIAGEVKEKMTYCLERDFWGYKKIHGLLADPNVEDISCNGYHMPVYAYLPGFESVPTNIRFESEEELDDFVMYLVQKGGKSISAANPIQDVALPDGSRLNVTLYREVSSNGTTFSIRLANRARGAAELLRNGTFSPESLAFLWLAMENRCSMSFIGGTASGKTAALNAVSSFIVEKNKVVTIEDTREVRLSSLNWTPLVVTGVRGCAHHRVRPSRRRIQATPRVRDRRRGTHARGCQGSNPRHQLRPHGHHDLPCGQPVQLLQPHHRRTLQHIALISPPACPCASACLWSLSLQVPRK